MEKLEDFKPLDTKATSSIVGGGVPGCGFRVPRPRLCPETPYAAGHRGQAPSEGQSVRGHERDR